MILFHKHNWKEVDRQPVQLRYPGTFISRGTRTIVTYQCQNNLIHYKQVRLRGFVGLDTNEWSFPYNEKDKV